MNLKPTKTLIRALGIFIFGFVVHFPVCTFAFEAKAQSVNEIEVSLNVGSSPTLRELMNSIEQSTGFKFSHLEDELKPSSHTVRIKRKYKSLGNVLFDVSRQIKLSFRRVNDKIYVRKEVRGFGAVTEIIEKEEVNVKGRVVDETGQGLPGASVAEKGTMNGIITDADGNYKLTVAEGATLVFSYLGYITQEVEIGNRTVIDVALKPDATQLDEVVVVGYGTQSRKTSAGAVDQISGEVLESRPITNSVNGLQGAIPGLVVTRSSGQPGNEGYNLNIRGISSVNGTNQPLVLIDGVEGNLNLVNPSDIETFSVLKDASAVIYGARAANGVILVTTKDGRKNERLKVSYTGNYSINKMSNLIDRVNTREWIEMEWEAKNNAGSNPTFLDLKIGNKTLKDVLAKVDAGKGPEYAFNTTNTILNYQNVDWSNLIFDGTGHQQLHNINLSGGGQDSKFNVSFGLVNTNGLFRSPYDDSRRMNMRLNYVYDISDRISLNTRISYVHQRNLSPAFSAERIIGSTIGIFTWLPPYTSKGDYLTQWFDNPLQLLDPVYGKTKSVSEEVRANISGKVTILDGLQLTTQATIDRSTGNTKRFTDRLYRKSYDDAPRTYFGRSSSFRDFRESEYLNLTGYLDYVKTFGEHNFNIIAGLSHEQRDFGDFSATARDFTQSKITTLGHGDPSQAQIREARLDWAIKSLFARFNYTFSSKYTAEFTYRRDGTSIFAPDVRWGNFTGVALAWRASEETFIKNLNVFDNLKIRVSQGLAGNQNLNDTDNINLYDYIPLIDVTNLNYPFGGGTTQTLSAVERGLVSNTRTWENLKNTNIGVDIALLDSKLSARFDWFRKQNQNMQLGINRPAVLGGTPPSANIGTLETQGFELSIAWQDKTSGGLEYSLQGILNDAQNKLTNLDGQDVINEGVNRAVQGYALNTYFGFVYDGILKTQEEVDAYTKLQGVRTDLQIGDAKYKDLNGDGRISVTDDEGSLADAIPYGDNAPRYSYSFNAGLGYKGFDFSLFLQGVAKRTIYYTDQWRLPFSQPWWQPLKKFYRNTWSPERQAAKYPRITTGAQRFWNYRTSQNTKINGAYLRVKNITLGYTLSDGLLKNIGLSGVRVFVSGEDLLTFDWLDGGYDAENTNGNANFYPFTKRFSMGLIFNF